MSLENEVTQEYQRGAEGSRGLAARWWKGSLIELLDMRVQDQERWLESVRLGTRKANKTDNADRKQC